ncbi:hypothetical protein PGT21_018947 [Puccinia graminis f. sp. tritici]|uniref:No apical meristem-associated C-terminal domain-containing protein n=1 Tax=Puccinia graminis f. sp. tritici TaxID=56615 RepID=A0A5B0P5Y3_PUCGR|nr:hypothetical protein PGTUg99_029331 [Puccinia graminis f. sp. tritici]KAA1099735.1 hypothetical protein PGT21_018947 [Puccinia graminis f. sp. tritici]
MKFSAHYNKIKDHPPSGSAPTDYLKLAKKSYYEETQKVFTYDSAWSILYTHAKWQDARGSCKKTQPTSDPVPLPQTSTQENTPVGNLESQGDDPTEVRPIGIKSAKRKEAEILLAQKKVRLLEKNSAEGSKRIAQLDRANKLQEETNQIQKERAQDLHLQNEMAIKDKEFSRLDQYAQEFYLTKKRRSSITCEDKMLPNKPMRIQLNRPCNPMKPKTRTTMMRIIHLIHC